MESTVHTTLRYSAVSCLILATLFCYGPNVYGGDEERKAKRLSWTKFFDMEGPPKCNIAGDFKPRDVSNGTLTMRTTGTQTGYYYIQDDSLNNLNGTTAEIRVKFGATPSDIGIRDAAMFAIRDGAREGKIAFARDRILVFDQNKLLNAYPVNTGQYQVYRIDIIENVLEVHVNGDLVASETLSNAVSAKGMITFGDLDGEEGRNLDASIDYLAYSNYSMKKKY